MSDLATSLWRAVQEAPDDDAPRLVLADALIEQGDPRGEFITAQCELARRGLDPERTFREWVRNGLALRADVDAELQRRTGVLQRQHGDRWRGSFPGVSTVEFRRGFVDMAYWAHPEVRDWGLDRIVEGAPLLRELHFHNVTSEERLREIYASPALGQIAELFPPSAKFNVPLLAASEHLARLRRLVLPNYAGACDLTVLAKAAFFPQLEGLVLANFALHPAAIETLFAATARLRELQIIDGRLGPEGAVALAAREPLGALEVLGLRRSKLGTAGLRAICASGRFRSVRALSLEKNKLGPGDIAPLFEAFPNLAVLDLKNNAIGDEGARAIAEHAPAALEVLALDGAGLGDAGATALAGSGMWSKLGVADLRNNKIGDTGAGALGASRPARLRQLYIGKNALAKDAKATLAERLSARVFT